MEYCRFCKPTAGAFDPRDQHPECGLRSVVGGIGHLTDHGYWCIGMGDPDMGLSYRESALRVAVWVKEHGEETAIAVPADTRNGPGPNTGPGTVERGMDPARGEA